MGRIIFRREVVHVGDGRVSESKLHHWDDNSNISSIKKTLGLRRFFNTTDMLVNVSVGI